MKLYIIFLWNSLFFVKLLIKCYLIEASTKPHVTVVFELFSFSESHVTIIVRLSFAEINGIVIYNKIIEDI